MLAHSLSRRLFATGSAAVTLYAPAALSGQVPKDSRARKEDSTLQSLLGLTPDLDRDTDRVTRFVNLVPHLDLFGLAPLASGAGPIDPRLPIVFGLGTLPMDVDGIKINPERWEELFGFHPFTLHALLDEGPSDDYLLLMRGTFDQGTVFAALERTGYVPSDESSDIWRLGLDFEAVADLAFDTGFLGFVGASYTHVTFLGDDTMALASDVARLEGAREALTAPSASLLGNDAIASLAQAMPPDLFQAMIVQGSAFEAEVPGAPPGVSDEQREEALAAVDAIEDEHGPMPSFDAAILGRTPGGPYRESAASELDTDQRSTLLASIALDDPGQADACVAIVSERFDVLYSMSLVEPYRNLLTLESAGILDNDIAGFTFTQEDSMDGDLFDLFNAKDLQFLHF
jgi:hypothetical protein